jgi:photosystem I reaction center subunit VIII
MSIDCQSIYCHFFPSFLPSIFVPLIGLVLPVLVITSFFIFVSEEKIN